MLQGVLQRGAVCYKSGVAVYVAGWCRWSDVRCVAPCVTLCVAGCVARCVQVCVAVCRAGCVAGCVAE